MSTENIDLLNGSIKKLVIKLSVPVMLSALLLSSYNFVDMIFASRLGGVQVASVAFVSPIFKLVFAFGNGISIGGLALIAKLLGQGKTEEASNHASQLRFMIILVAFLISITGILFTDVILNFLGLNGELLEKSAIYTRIRFFSIPFSLTFVLYMSLYKSQGKMNITLKMSLIGLIGNSILNSLFLYVFKTGIGGLAYATLITQVIQVIIMILTYHKETHNFHLNLFIFKDKLDFKYWKKILKIGTPLAFSQASTDIGFLLINMFIVPYGYQVVAAFALGNQINSLFFSPNAGIGQSLIPLVAQNYGKKSLSRVKESIKVGLTYNVAFSIYGTIMLNILMPYLGGFLAKGDIGIYNNIINYMRLCSSSLIGWAAFQFFNNVFNGLHKTKISVYTSVFRLWVIRIPSLILFRYVFTSVNEYGVWIVMAVSNLATGLFALILFLLYSPKIYKRIND